MEVIKLLQPGEESDYLARLARVIIERSSASEPRLGTSSK